MAPSKEMEKGYLQGNALKGLKIRCPSVHLRYNAIHESVKQRKHSARREPFPADGFDGRTRRACMYVQVEFGDVWLCQWVAARPRPINQEETRRSGGEGEFSFGEIRLGRKCYRGGPIAALHLKQQSKRSANNRKQPSHHFFFCQEPSFIDMNCMYIASSLKQRKSNDWPIRDTFHQRKTTDLISGSLWDEPVRISPRITVCTLAALVSSPPCCFVVPWVV